MDYKYIGRSYHKAVKLTAKNQGKLLKDFAEVIGVVNTNNITLMLKKSYANSMIKALHPFKALGAEVEVVITCKNGKKIVIR